MTNRQLTPLQSKSKHAPLGTSNRLLFITGTDTGVGKTVLSALLLCHLRATGCRALAMKPIATGNPADADLLDRVQDGALPRALLNPFLFSAPVAPLVAARAARLRVRMSDVANRIREAADRCDLLLIEGCGGLLTPLGDGFTLLDMIRVFRASVVLVARNRLGVLNRVLLCWQVLACSGVSRIAVALMATGTPDRSAHSNAETLREITHAQTLIEIPHLGRVRQRPACIRTATARLHNQLSALATFAWGRGRRRAAAVH